MPIPWKVMRFVCAHDTRWGIFMRARTRKVSISSEKAGGADSAEENSPLVRSPSARAHETWSLFSSRGVHSFNYCFIETLIRVVSSVSFSRPFSVCSSSSSSCSYNEHAHIQTYAIANSSHEIYILLNFLGAVPELYI